jgi:pimeloyl-ACP methyl ester carboxylesterase
MFNRVRVKDALVTFPFHTTGRGPALLLLHGAGEDAGMLAPQAEAFAAAGRRVAWFDRRGTGTAPRDGWPDGGVEQHADDAADVVGALGGRVQVLGFSSGGVVALALAARHPQLDLDVIAWEPPVVSALDGGTELHDRMVQPLRAHLARHPGDWTGAFAVMLDTISGGTADLASEAVARQMANAEAAVRDDAEVITRYEIPAGSLPADRVRLARCAVPNDLHAAVVARLAALHGLQVVDVAGTTDHEVYLNDPAVLAAVDWSR